MEGHCICRRGHRKAVPKQGHAAPHACAVASFSSRENAEIPFMTCMHFKWLYISGSCCHASNQGARSGISPRSQARSSGVEFEPFRWAWGRPVYVTCRPRKAGKALMARPFPCCLLMGCHAIEALRGGTTNISRQ